MRSVFKRLHIVYDKASPTAPSPGFSVHRHRSGRHVVSDVQAGSPADIAGLMLNDTIVELGVENVTSLHTQVVCQKMDAVASAIRSLDLGVSRLERVVVDKKQPSGNVEGSGERPQSRRMSQRESTSDLLPRRISLADKLRRRQRTTVYDLGGLPIMYVGDDPHLEDVGTVVRTGSLMYWPCVAGGLTPEKKGKSRVVLLSERSIMVCKIKPGGLFKLKTLIRLEADTVIKGLSAASFTGSQSRGFLCAFAVVQGDRAQHVFAAKTIVEKQLWLGRLEILLRHVGATNP